MFLPADIHTMSRLAMKNLIHYSFYLQFLKFFLYRFLVVAGLCLGVFMWVLAEVWGGGTQLVGFGVSEEELWEGDFLEVFFFL